MGDHSKIEWTDASWNPVRARNLATGGIGHFCIHASEGCRNCYSWRFQPRFHNPIRFAAQDRGKVEIFLDEKMLTQPLRWKRPRKIFVGSMTDLFADFVTDDMLDRIFAVMALCPQHIFQLLTKRQARMRAYLLSRDPVNGENELVRQYINDLVIARGGEWLDDFSDLAWPLPNVWLGVSVEDQSTADERVPLLLDTPAAVRFVSYEPALGPIDFTRIAQRQVNAGTPHPPQYEKIDALDGTRWSADHKPGWVGLRDMPRLDWIICGGESGPVARPMYPDWARSVRDQCAAAGVPFFFKQWGEYGPPSTDAHRERIRSGDGYGAPLLPCGSFSDANNAILRLGRQAAGRLLDGREHNDLPQPETIRSQPAAG